MKPLKVLSISIFLILHFTLLFSQTVKDLSDKRKNIEQNIKRLNVLISETSSSKNTSMNEMSLIRSKLNLKKQLISQIDNEISYLEKQIFLSRGCIDSLTCTLQKRNNEFANVIQKSFNNRDVKYVFIYLLSSQNFNQAYLRAKFFKQIMQYQSQKLEEIKTIINERSVHSAMLQTNVSALQVKKNERKSEINILNSDIVDYEAKILSYQKREKQLRTELQEETKKALAIENQIKRIIEEERRKRETDSKRKIVDVKLGKNFSDNIGLFPSPVRNAVVTSTFGEHNHPVLKGVKINNNGIDFSVPSGSAIYSIFDGEISKIFNVPLSGVAIIIRHGNFFTVYSNLRDVVVKLGDKVTKMQKLGEIESGDENNGILHFEIWNERSPENPAKWLSEFR